MTRTYSFVSDDAVVIFRAPDGLEEAEADAWAEDHLAEVVQRPEEFWMDDVLEDEDDNESD